jgi:hypothetical protein
MDLNLINVLYMFFRLSPFIIVSYFTLQSILNQDLKGVIYLIGLIVTSFVVYLIASVLPEEAVLKNSSDLMKIKCTQLTIGQHQPISKLPLSQTVFGYTLTYLSYFIGVNNLQSQNIPIFILFPFLILGDIFWSTTNSCSSPKYLLISLIISGIVGLLWAMLIESTGVGGFAYLTGIANKDVCSRPTKSLYKCRSIKKTA